MANTENSKGTMYLISWDCHAYENIATGSIFRLLHFPKDLSGEQIFRIKLISLGVNTSFRLTKGENLVVSNLLIEPWRSFRSEHRGVKLSSLFVLSVSNIELLLAEVSLISELYKNCESMFASNVIHHD